MEDWEKCSLSLAIDAVKGVRIKCRRCGKYQCVNEKSKRLSSSLVFSNIDIYIFT